MPLLAMRGGRSVTGALNLVYYSTSLVWLNVSLNINTQFRIPT